MQAFIMYRENDVTGVSGTGIVAKGVIFDDGVTVIRWNGAHRSTVVWSNLADAIAIHSHDGATKYLTVEVDKHLADALVNHLA